MNYEKKYDEALERARKLKENPQSVFNEYSPKEGDTICDYIFPELKKSEDEKIRKEIIAHCRNTRCVTEEGAERIAKWIAWLEKQGEQKPTDKVEPKFKDGDVLFMDNGSANCIFIYKSSNNGIINKYASYNNFGFEGEHYLVLNDGYVISATKEQRDLLFQKMKEAGYEWDFEKKELKKIEQKSAWSEEDEKMVANLVDYFKLDDALQYTEKQVVDWLKSLKDRIQPQPKQEWSEEDQNALEDVREAVVHYWGGDTQDILLYWLKSLKQRIAP